MGLLGIGCGHAVGQRDSKKDTTMPGLASTAMCLGDFCLKKRIYKSSGLNELVLEPKFK